MKNSSVNFSYNSQNSDAEHVSFTLETSPDDYLHLHDKAVYSHYLFLKKFHITNPFFVRVCNLLVLIFLMSLLISMLSVFAFLIAFASFNLYNSLLGQIQWKELALSFVCFCLALLVILMFIIVLYNVKSNCRMRIHYIKHAKRIMHFAPGYNGQQEDSTCSV